MLHFGAQIELGIDDPPARAGRFLDVGLHSGIGLHEDLVKIVGQPTTN
jgi:hypothetical protein